jgi:23S rRNA pseudouridine1911/1915/1917 synthase
VKIELKISERHVGKRFDVAISDLCPHISRSRIQLLIRTEKVLIDGIAISNPAKTIQGRAQISIDYCECIKSDYEIKSENIPVDILFEDEHLIVINKPAGLVCHPAPGHRSGTLVNAMMYHFDISDIGSRYRPGIVHRLDKDTSGVMLLAKTNEALDAFSSLFAEGKGTLIKRKYICFVFGIPSPKSGEIRTFITRHPKNRKKYTVSDNFGKHAVTIYSVGRSRYFTATESISKVSCELLTGRTHQIRVHMQHIGHHIIGDQVYGRTKIGVTYPKIIKTFNRQALHSSELSFLHPFTREFLTFSKELPNDLQELNSLLFTNDN